MQTKFTRKNLITLDQGWKILLHDLSIEPQSILVRAGLPSDLFDGEHSHIEIGSFFKFCEQLDREANDPGLAIRLGTAIRPEIFDPVHFAALCCPDLRSALKRLGEFKALIAPITLRLEESEDGLIASWAWNDSTLQPPKLLMAIELISKVQLARLGTREKITPVQVSCPVPLEPQELFVEYFGVVPQIGVRQELVFALSDASRPFLTARESWWNSFEPGLRQRRAVIDGAAPLEDRVQAVLLECLPSGEATISTVANRLGMGARTLQRRLDENNIVFRELIKNTRFSLAAHYLRNTDLPYSQISLLIGFNNAGSFFRAFREWTGLSPEEYRFSFCDKPSVERPD